MLRRSYRPWSALLLLAACADYERPTRACDRLGLLCIEEDVTHDLGLARSKGVTGDLDGDDVRDLVSAAEHGLSIAWGPTNAREYRLIAGGVSGAKLGDVDDDGDLDIVYVTTEPASLRVLENRGKRELVDGPTLALAGRAESLWLGRLDTDDSLDAIVGGSDGARLTVITEGLRKTTTIPVGSDLAAVEAGDLDGDGRLDIVAADRSDAAVHVVLAQGGGFAAPRRISTGIAPRYLQLYDLDGDDNLDILTHGDGREIWLHQNTGTGEFAAPRALVVQNEASPGFAAHRDEQGRRWLITIDDDRTTASRLDESDEVVGRVLQGGSFELDGLDIDGDELLTHGQWYGERLSLAPSHMFSEVWHGGTEFPEHLVIADVDLDGTLDLVAAASELTIRRGLDDGTWGEPTRLVLPQNAISMVVADVTGDDLPDVVIGDRDPSLYVAVQAADGSFTLGPPASLPGAPKVLYAGLAAPGEPAAVAAGGSGLPGVFVLRFDSTGAMTEQSEVLTDDRALSLSAADVDDDGTDDLVVLTWADDEASALVIVPRVDGGWGPATTRSLADVYPVSLPDNPLQALGLVLGDIDLDGSTDAVLVGAGAIVRLLDFAADVPSAPQVDPIFTIGAPTSLALADIDGDTRPDIVACGGASLQNVLVPAEGPMQAQTPLFPDINACALHVDPELGVTAMLGLRGRGLSVLRPDLAPALTPTAFLIGGLQQLHGLATGDIDADGHTDIVVTDALLPAPGSAVLWGDPTGRPRRADWQQMSIGADPSDLTVAPLDDRPGDEIVIAWVSTTQIWTHADGDLRLDATVANAPGTLTLAVGVQTRTGEASDVIVLGSNADGLGLTALPRGDDGRFDEHSALYMWTSSRDEAGAAMTIADLDTDGFDDIAVLTGDGPYAGRALIVVWGDHARSGEATLFGLALPDARNIGSGDLDGDGAPELVLGGDQGVVDYSFAGRDLVTNNIQARGAARILLVADLEHDGHADFLRVEGNNLDIILRSSGDDAVTNLELGGPWTELHAAHLDGDEILDLLGLQDGKLVTRLSAGAAAPE